MKPSYLQYVDLDALDVPGIRARLAEVAAFTAGARPDPYSDPTSSIRWWTTGGDPYASGWRQLQIRIGLHGERRVALTRSTERHTVVFEEGYSVTSDDRLGKTGESEIGAAVAAWRRALRLPAFVHPSGVPAIVDVAAGIARDVAAMLIQSGRADHGASSLDITLPTIGVPGSLASSHGGQPLVSTAVATLVARLPLVMGLKGGSSVGDYALCAASALLRVDLPDLSAVEAMRAVAALPPELSRPSAIGRRLRA